MTAPKIVAGITGTDRIYCQFWGEWSNPAIKQIRTVEYAHMSTDQGLSIAFDCPPYWVPQVFAAYLELLGGTVPTPTHTASFQFNATSPVLTEVDA